MSRFIFISLLSIALLSSCKMEQEYWINKDGGGEQTFTMDMSGMGSMAKMFDGAMEDETIDEEILEENIKNELDQEAIEELMDGEPSEDFNLADLLTNPGSMGEVDTMMIMYDIMPDSLKSHPDAHLAKKMFMKVKSSESEDDMSMTFGLKYKDKAEFDKVSAAFGDFLAQSGSKDSGASMGANPASQMSSFFSYDYILDAKRGTVIIPEHDLSEEMKEGMGDEEMDMDFEDPEERAMFEMMFGDSGYKITYHLPGPVEFTSEMNAEIDGNSVTFNYPMLEIMELEKIPKKVIKYRP